MFVDSGIWIAAKLKRDQWHQDAVEILKRNFDKETGNIYVNEYVVMETVNFLLKKAGFEVAEKTLRIFQSHDRIKILKIDDDIFNLSCFYFQLYRGLSLTDGSIVANMEQSNIKDIYSFDSGFDMVDGIVRLSK